jgi:sec-independent protein translocase protein TatA
MPLGIGPLEIIIVLIIVLIIFGPKRLPGLGRSLGAGLREFKDSVTGKGGDADAASDADAPKAEIDAAAESDGATSASTGETAETAGKRAAKS